jgi:hypothetical protein
MCREKLLARWKINTCKIKACETEMTPDGPISSLSAWQNTVVANREFVIVAGGAGIDSCVRMAAPSQFIAWHLHWE